MGVALHITYNPDSGCDSTYVHATHFPIGGRGSLYIEHVNTTNPYTAICYA